MKRKKGLCLVLLLCLLLTGCAAERPVEDVPAQESTPYMLPEGTQVLDPDNETLLIAAVGYDPANGKTRITSAHILVKDFSGATAVLTLPKDTRAWIDHYEGEQVIYGEYDSLSRVYAAGESAGKGVQNLQKAVTNLLGGVTIDKYALMNAVQLEMLAETTDGVYVTVESPIPDYEINAGYQEITSRLQSYAAYSYLSDVSGKEYNGTDKDKLTRHQELMQATFAAMQKKLKSSDAPEETAQRMVECISTNLTAQELISWVAGDPATVFTDFSILPGSHFEDDSVSLWLYDNTKLTDWIISHFYTQPEE